MNIETPTYSDPAPPDRELVVIVRKLNTGSGVWTISEYAGTGLTPRQLRHARRLARTHLEHHLEHHLEETDR